MSDVDEPLLRIRDLVVRFATEDGPLTAVDGVSIEARPGEVVGIVGESGSGKSVTVMSILGLLPGSASVDGGSIEWRGTDLAGLPARAMRRIKGRDIAVVFQDPMTSLNPVLTVGWQLREAVRAHQPELSRPEVAQRAVELLEAVGVPDARTRVRQFPHQFSGGMRQRAMIAMAVANQPALLIADEPTTALDVTVQAQVLRVLTDPNVRADAAMLLVTHDLGLVAERAHRVVVMYGGRVVESGDVREIFRRPRHPYTVALLRSLPRLDDRVDRLASIPGAPPGLADRPPGCPFEPRCWLGNGRPECVTTVPPLLEVGVRHHSACHFVDELEAGAEPMVGSGVRS
ncbi:ABC transporter ATP-binding protein [Jiangella gansuensis]|uniref:ABC transporter ATP-binding protein n=1 Tax=Jiangella gansuensis TaxID=281473 RepID=UPI0004AFE2CF|nr:ABC transporter ATP-binding protein [Jiangella gansuensis]